MCSRCSKSRLGSRPHTRGARAAEQEDDDRRLSSRRRPSTGRLAPRFECSCSYRRRLSRRISRTSGCCARSIWHAMPARPPCRSFQRGPGNGALEALEVEGLFRPPRLRDLERSLALGQARAAGRAARVFADLWDLERFADCEHCLGARRDRLRAMNVVQRFLPQPLCQHCGLQ